MNEIQRNHILQNLDLLIENTLNIRRLFIYLDAFNLLPFAERQVLLSFPDDSTRLREMFKVLTQKDVDSYYIIIRCLELSGNARASHILEEHHQHISASRGIGIKPNVVGDDFQVLPKHVPTIVEILETTEISPYDWGRITADLFGNNYRDLINLPTPSMAFKMMKTLDEWFEKNEISTFSHLLSVISRTNRTASDALLIHKDEILDAE